ncbi:hypothetical protein EDD16DRAFT_1527239 [Pisolithus croceorrhizus]|nr:hypothetical protein EDD16DRAFT_1527239 [Pisolithus croceorrhizus]KAI6137798.1 hypothetical protein EDD17DRAFT_1517068 [Pisolithus thermaeus]
MPSFAEPPFKQFQDLNDNTIISGESTIQDFESRVKVIKTEHGDLFVYAVESNDENAKTYKIVIGPIEVTLPWIDITIDLKNLTIVIEVYANIPFVGKVQIAKTVGNLRDGVTLTIGYPPFIGGSLTLKLDGKNVVLGYSFDALGFHCEGSKVIITLH